MSFISIDYSCLIIGPACEHLKAFNAWYSPSTESSQQYNLPRTAPIKARRETALIMLRVISILLTTEATMSIYADFDRKQTRTKPYLRQYEV